MIIWIVDDDVSFAYGLKSTLKATDRTLEVFTDVQAFLSKLQKKKKDKAPLPDLIFIDFEFPGKSGGDIYLDFLKQSDPLAQKFFFCSSASYGRFEQFFDEHKTTVPPFIQKSQLTHEIDKILRDYNPQKEEPRFVNFMTKRNMVQLESCLKELKDLYYGPAFKKEDLQRFIDAIHRIRNVLILMKREDLARQADAVFELLQGKTPGLMRIKKEIKDLIQLLDKFKP